VTGVHGHLVGKNLLVVDDKFFQQNYFNLVGSYSTVVYNVFMEHLKNLAHLFFNVLEILFIDGCGTFVVW
jgi:hypothetical protein